MTTPYVYVAVRRDLSPAQQAVQACHACIEAARRFPAGGDHPHIVLLGVDAETDLLALSDRLAAAGLPFAAFREPDIGNQLTAVATAPLYAQERRMFREFRLLHQGD